MSRNVSDAPITTRTSRARLDARSKPSSGRSIPNLCIGYIKSKSGGRWIMRAYDGGGRYHQEGIGVADDHQDADGSAVLDYGQASKLVRDRYTRRHRRRKALPEDPSGSYKVRQAVIDYVVYLRNERKSADTVKSRLNAYIGVNDLGEVEGDDLTTSMITQVAVRHRQHAGAPSLTEGRAEIPPIDPENPEDVRRRRASANLTFAFLRAALNRAWRGGKIALDTAWRKIPPFQETDKPRERYLELDEVARLPTTTRWDDLRDLFTGGVHSGARPSELGRLKVRDYHHPSGTLHVGKSKAARQRDIVVSKEAQVFFRQLCAGRDNDEPMFLRRTVRRGKVKAIGGPPLSQHVKPTSKG